jgi:hypothetical protein
MAVTTTTLMRRLGGGGDGVDGVNKLTVRLRTLTVATMTTTRTMS